MVVVSLEVVPPVVPTTTVDSSPYWVVVSLAQSEVVVSEFPAFQVVVEAMIVHAVPLQKVALVAQHLQTSRIPKIAVLLPCHHLVASPLLLALGSLVLVQGV